MTMDGVDMADPAWPLVGAETQRTVQSDAERLTAAAAVLLSRVVEPESLVQALAHEVELSAVDVGQALGVDQHLDAMLFEYVVSGCDVVGVLQLVGQARAAR